MTNKKKRIIIFTAIILTILVVMFLLVTDGLSEGMKIQPSGIDLSEVPDGSYTGVYEFKRWSNTVEVRVKDHRIIAVDIVKDILLGEAQGASGEIISRVITQQNTTVDAVSGATVSSKAYLTAIENAVKK